MRTDVVIIGSGLIGSMTAKYLRDVKGMQVVIVDQVNPMSASKCSFGIWKDSWVNKIIRKEYEDGLDLLDTFTGGLQEHKFLIKPKPYRTRSIVDKYDVPQETREEVFRRADCSLILNEDFLRATLLSIDRDRVTVLGLDGKQEVIVGKHIIIAAGVWTTDILIENGLMNNLPYLDYQWGSVFKLKRVERDLPVSQMKEWAPYKQSVFINEEGKGREALFGDGVTIKNVKAGDKRLEACKKRILQHMQELLGTGKYNGNVTEIMEGYRPYLNKTKTSTGKFVNKHSDWVISATGGAKNSTILCGHMAKEVWRLMKG